MVAFNGKDQSILISAHVCKKGQWMWKRSNIIVSWLVHMSMKKVKDFEKGQTLERSGSICKSSVALLCVHFYKKVKDFWKGQTFFAKDHTLDEM